MALSSSQRFYAIVGLTAVILGFASEAFYRDFIYSNQIDDFGFANFLPSYFYVIGFSQLLLIQLSRFSRWIILSVTLASVGYEFMQFAHSTAFDLGDSLASIVGGISSLLLLQLKSKYFKS
ncbi:MAG: hypothetical protein PHV20_08625 [Bacteroidales bacterium]|nr:hypothetical protein [Bacteroidales bacterium]